MPDDVSAFNDVILSTWTVNPIGIYFHYHALKRPIQPDWTQQINKPMPDIPGLSSLSPGYAKVPLPESVASPRGTSVNIDVESPSSPRSRAFPSQASRKAPTVRSEQQASAGPGVSYFSQCFNIG